MHHGGATVAVAEFSGFWAYTPYLGIEKETDYCAIAERRLAATNPHER
jgi:hypothetical protein